MQLPSLSTMDRSRHMELAAASMGASILPRSADPKSSDKNTETKFK